jgi:lambda repressor-like predicted transcriptional regulator
MTQTQDSLRAELIREMHKTGCRLDDAAACADVAMQFVRKLRAEVITALSLPAMTVRQIARKKGMSKSRVHQILSIDGARGWTPEQSILPPAA